MYDKELENVEVYEKFQDLVKTFELHRGKVKPGEEATVVGEFKVREIVQYKLNILQRLLPLVTFDISCTLVVKSVSTFASHAEELKEMFRATAVEPHLSDLP